MIEQLASVPAAAADRIIERGWHKGGWVGEDGSECLHQAVRMCAMQTGDGFIVSAWLEANGYPTSWNDAADRERDDVLFLLKELDLRDKDFEATFGAYWRQWVALVRLVASMTPEQARRLEAAWKATGVVTVAWNAAGEAARVAAGVAAGVAARVAARVAAGVAAWNAAWKAAGAIIGRDHLDPRYYDALMAPIFEVFGREWLE